MKIRVYIYTAVNGYSWQGCDKELAKSLDICLGSSWKTAAPNGSSAMGGIRRGEVGGLNGTAIFRVHVRRNGDFAGRDSDYVALAFLPFAQIGERFVDYTGLWNHRLLAAPLERDLDVQGKIRIVLAVTSDCEDSSFAVSFVSLFRSRARFSSRISLPRHMVS